MRTIIVVAVRHKFGSFMNSMNWDQRSNSRSMGVLGDTEYQLVQPNSDPERFKARMIDGVIELDKPNMNLGIVLYARRAHTAKHR